MVSCWEITAILDHMNLVMRVTIPSTMAVSEETMRRKVEKVSRLESCGLVDTGEIWREEVTKEEEREAEKRRKRGKENREGKGESEKKRLKMKERGSKERRKEY